ncbi:MAG TPA: leucyl aminopeptidase [Terriglobales bacterium]|nr:leucyl aminopeptidase [Terriglobales bacterium]
MNVKLSFANPAEIETDCLAIIALDESAEPKNGKPEPRIQTGEKRLQDAAEEVIASGEVTGKIFETVMIHRPKNLIAKRLLVIGGGKAKNFSSIELRKLAGTAVRFLKPKNIKSFVFVAPQIASGATDSAKSVVEGAFVGNFDPDKYKSDRKDQSVDEVTIAGLQQSDDLQKALDEARVLGESQNFTRELVNEPGNRMTPSMLAARAREMAEAVGLKWEIMGAEQIRQMNMGAFWSVAQGSDEPPALIVLRYEPEDAPEKPVIGLVGKGITFDSGGISIKPSEGMEKMKYDMAGGAAMLGAMRAIALLKPKVKVIGIVCATENMPSGKAQKPGDVQIAMSGKSIEIINTDAEGRLVLADGLHYARQLGATHLIDAATLTGACVVALGYVNAGVFANDDQMYEHFVQATRRAGEKMWRLPVDPEYQEMIRSSIADIVNSGGRWGGAVTAAMFLKEFVEDTPWIHLDIAGTAWVEDNKAWIAKGPSGIAVRSIVEYVKDVATGDGGRQVGFTGGTQTGTRTATQDAKTRSDTGAGL